MPHITIYAGARNPRPIRQDDFADWDELADALEDLATRTAEPGVEKRDLTAFAPHRLRVPYRAEANVEAVTLLVLDVDVVADLDALLARCRAWSEHGLVYASPSDTPAHRKVRVVLPVTAEIAPKDSRHVRLAAAEALGLAPGCGVEGAVEAAKLFFIGGLHGTPTREVWRW